MKLQILPKYRSALAAGSLIGLVLLNVYINLSAKINPASGETAYAQGVEKKQSLNNKQLKNSIDYLIEAGEKQIVPKLATPLFPSEAPKKIDKSLVKSPEQVNRVLPTLNIILNDSQRPIALINGRFIGVGQKIDSGDTIVSINDESIILQDEKNIKYIVKLKNIYQEKQSVKE